MPEKPTFILDIEWDKADLPSLVGPFETQTEAVQWGNQNIPNGTWSVRPVAWPYLRARHVNRTEKTGGNR